MDRYVGVLGVVLILGVGVLFSSNRRRINWRVVLVGIVFQFMVAALCLKDFIPGFSLIRYVIEPIAEGFTKGVSFGDAGTEFIFGKAADASQPWGFIFAVKVLPIIIFFAALMSVLYHIKVMRMRRSPGGSSSR